MAKREIKAGATSQTIDVFIQDSSVSTGAGLTGLVYNTASLTAYYRKGATGTPTAITLATQTVGGAYSSGGFVAVDGTNCPGQYRLDLPNAMVDTAGMVTLYLRGATNMAPCVMEIEVAAVDKFDGVRYGLTALPNAAAAATGGLNVMDANGGIAANITHTGTAQAGSGLTITLASGASSVSNTYRHQWVQIISGPGAGESRQIDAYVGSTRVVTVNYAWQTTPTSSSVYRVIAAHTPFCDVSGYVYALNTSGALLATGSQATTITNTLGTPAGASIAADIAAVPTAAANASQVRTELTTELGRIDVATSTRLAGASYSAPPTAASIRAEIDSNSTKLDVATSTRLASGSYTAPLDAAGTRTAVGLATASLDTQLAGIAASSAPSAATIAAEVVSEMATAPVGSVSEKTGFKLASDGLDAISTTAPTGVAANFREMIVQTWRRFFKKSVYDKNTETLKTYANDGTTVLTTQSLATEDDVETQGNAS